MNRHQQLNNKMTPLEKQVVKFMGTIGASPFSPYIQSRLFHPSSVSPKFAPFLLQLLDRTCVARQAYDAMEHVLQVKRMMVHPALDE